MTGQMAGSMTGAEAAPKLQRDGFVTLPWHGQTARWAAAAHHRATALAATPKARADWLRCAGTWFAGVDLLDNTDAGAVDGVPLAGPALALLAQLGLTPAAWHRAQVSILYPGYPRPREGESETAARYRARRDAAHLDGLLPVGPARKRMLREPHAFILGLPLTQTDPRAGPLVAWRGSHRILGDALRAALQPYPQEDWPNVDLSAAYQTARRACFEHCARVPLPAQPGQATLLHRHCLHGMGPWPTDLPDPGGAGRMVAYFRPQFPRLADWCAD